MDVECLGTQIHRRLEAVGNPERRRVAVTYFPTAMTVIGVSVPDIRAIVRDVSSLLKKEPPCNVLSLAHTLLEGDTFEGRQAAYEILARHRPALSTLRTEAIERLGKGIDNWASVDAYACLIAGPAWHENRVTDSAVTRWARSDDRWWRRAAVVCTVPLNQKSRGGTGDTPRTLCICDLVAADNDEMVAKGLSWALRELAKRDREAAREFVSQHESVLAARVRREVWNKLQTGLKTPRLR